MATPKKTLDLDVDFDGKGFDSAVTSLEKGLAHVTDTWARDLEQTIDSAMKSAVRSALNDGTSRALWHDLLTSPLGEMRNMIKEMIEDGDESGAAMLQRSIKEQAQAQEELAKSRENALEELRRKEKRAIDEQIDEMRTGVQSIGTSILGGDVSGFLDLLKGKGKDVRQRGLAQQGLAKEREFEDPTGAAQKMKMGETMAKLGTGISAFASAAMGLVAVVKLFLDLDSKIKDMNKGLVETAGAADFGFGRSEFVAGKLASELENIRDETTAVNENFMKFRGTAKEQQEILSQLNQAGFTYARIRKEIEDTTTATKSYSDVTALALTYSKTLGISGSEAAQTLSQYALDTGDTLENVAQQLSVITREASSAGFATKRFFSTISEATSGMAFYGVRVEETARLLKGFDSILGEQLGADTFKQLVNQYKDKGAQDRLRELILKDQDFAQEQFSKSFQRQIAALSRDLGGPGGPLDGVDMKKLLNQGEIPLTQELKRRGLKPEQINRMMNARLVGKAAEGDMGSMVRGMGMGGQGFELALASQAGPVFGGKRIDEVLRSMANGGAGAAEMAALESVTGKSLDQLEKLARLFTGAEADLGTLKTISKKMTDNVELTAEDVKAQKRIEKELDLFVDRQSGEIRKGFRDAQGGLVRENAVAIKDAMDVVTQTPTEGESTMVEALNKDQQIATEIAKNTSSLNSILEQTISAILNDIYDVIIGIADWLFRDDRGRQREIELKRAEADRRKTLERDAKIHRSELQMAQTELEKARQGGDTVQIAQMEKVVAQFKRQADDAAVALERQDAIKNSLDSMSDAMTSGKGAGAGVVVDALEKQGHKFFSNGDAKDAFLGALDAALPRYAEVTTSGLSGWGEVLAQDWRALQDDMDNWSSNFVDAAKGNTELMGRLRGGEDTLAAAAAAGDAAARAVSENMGWLDWGFTSSEALTQQQGEAFSAAAAAIVSQNLKSDQELKAQNQELVDAVKEMTESVSASQSPLIQGALGLLGMRRANDLIIPSDGKPIMLDSKDTVTASKPGGALDQATRGRGGPRQVNINIHGGDSQKVYQVVKRVLQAQR